MHVCIDYRPALREGTGVGTYVRGLLAGLAERHPEVEISAFSASWRDRIEADAAIASARPVDARVPVRALDWLWNRRQWPPVELWTGGIDLTHSPSPLPLPSIGARTVVTVHDCYFLRNPGDVDGVVRRDYVPLVRRAVEGADAIVVVSETTRAELLDLFALPEEKVFVTYNGVEEVFRPVPEARARIHSKFGIERPYLLFAGRREPRKDLPTLLAAFAALAPEQPNVDLVLVGPDGRGWKESFANVAPALRERIRLLPHQPADRLAVLYSGAEALLLPSRWEGFGLTAVEAMACGTPVIAARAGALPEVLQDAALWFDRGDVEALADCCRRILEESDLRRAHERAGTQQAARYSWGRTADLTHAMYRQLLS